MKKIIIAAAIIFTTGIIVSCSQQSNTKTASTVAVQTLLSGSKDLASGD